MLNVKVEKHNMLFLIQVACQAQRGTLLVTHRTTDLRDCLLNSGSASRLILGTERDS